MNINLVRLKGVERQLARLNRNIERYLAHVYDLSPEPLSKNKVASEEPEPDVSYTDEAMDAIREYVESKGQRLPQNLFAEDEAPAPK